MKGRAYYQRRSKKTAVYVITSEKVIQAVLTGSVVGAVTSWFEGTSVLISRSVVNVLGVFVPAKWILTLWLLGLFAAALWADNHTEEWRELVEEATGEEAAEDEQ